VEKRRNIGCKMGERSVNKENKGKNDVKEETELEHIQMWMKEGKTK